MILTEEEAAKKWCPFVDTGIHTRNMPCIGSGCMAWRWNPEPKPGENLESVVVKMINLRGHCGLAGAA